MSITAARDKDGIVTITLDDGKVNAFDLEVFAALDKALDDASDARAVVVTGREGMLSAGLNTKALAALDVDGLAELLVTFGRTMLRIWTEPRPVVVAATGHAIAGGTILAMCADHAVAAAGDYRWGLTETTIGFPLPHWIITIARGNLRNDRLDDLLLPGTLLDPAAAVEAGYADVVAPADAVLDTAMGRARELAQLPAAAYAETKRRLRQEQADTALAVVEGEIAELLAARGTGA